MSTETSGFRFEANYSEFQVQEGDLPFENFFEIRGEGSGVLLYPEPELLYPLGLAGTPGNGTKFRAFESFQKIALFDLLPRLLKSVVLADKLFELDELLRLGLLLGSEIRGGGSRNGFGFTFVGPFDLGELVKFISELDDVSRKALMGVIAVDEAEGK